MTTNHVFICLCLFTEAKERSKIIHLCSTGALVRRMCGHCTHTHTHCSLSPVSRIVSTWPLQHFFCPPIWKHHHDSGDINKAAFNANNNFQLTHSFVRKVYSVSLCPTTVVTWSHGHIQIWTYHSLKKTNNTEILRRSSKLRHSSFDFYEWLHSKLSRTLVPSNFWPRRRD